jgi:glycosyltransferase involved in cell wall biosynthesis
VNTKISVIIPVYNVEKYLSKCLDSVLQQDFDSYEIIAVNDGSKDSCGEILKEYSSRNEKIVVVNQENKGLVL